MKKIILLITLFISSFGFSQQFVVVEKDTTSINECNIERIDDEIERTVTFYTPFDSSLGIVKTIRKGVATYYLSLDAYSSYCSVGGTGAVILFTDGTRLNKTVKIDTDVNSGNGYRYSAFISLTSVEVTMFTKKKIKKFKLYIFDEDISSDKADKFIKNLKCILKSKK